MTDCVITRAEVEREPNKQGLQFLIRRKCPKMSVSKAGETADQLRDRVAAGTEVEAWRVDVEDDEPVLEPVVR